MSKIVVEISPSVTAKQRNDGRFIKLHAESEWYFNSPYFTAKERRSLVLHEAGHIVYARLAGAENVKFFGPEMFWDHRPELGYDSPAISKCSVEWCLPECTTPTDAVNACVASFIIREVLDTPNDEVAISSDLDRARDEYLRFGGAPDEFDRTVEKARGEILAYLRNPEFVRRINETATEFADAVFPQRSVKRCPAPKVGRNNPCPCGSARKFKRCCG